MAQDVGTAGHQSVVTIAPAAEAYGLGIDDVVFTLTRTEPLEAALAVEVALTQAGEYLDAEALTRTVTFEPGNSSAELRIRRHMFSATATQTGDLSAAVRPGSGYLVGLPSSATVRMAVADPAVTVRLEQDAYRFVEGPEYIERHYMTVVVRTAAGVPPPAEPLHLGMYNRGSSAESIRDYRVMYRRLYIAADEFTADGDGWQARREVPFEIYDDAEVEEDEVLFQILVLWPTAIPTAISGVLRSRVAVLMGDSDEPCDRARCVATVTILDDDSAPRAPRSLTAVPANGAVELSWDAPVEVTGLELVTKHQFRLSADRGLSWSDWTDIAQSGVGEVHAGGFRVTNLSNGPAYRFEVRAVSAKGAGDAAEVELQTVVTIAPEREAYGLDIDDVVFTLTRTEPVEAALAVEVALTQAGEYLDAEALTRTVTFEPGNSTAELRIHRYMFSASATQTGDLSAAVRPGSGYLVGSASSATVRMVVADPAVTVRLEQAEYRFVEGAGAASVAVVARTVAGIPRPSGGFDVAVSTQSMPGGAERGTDYVILAKLVNFVGEDFTADGDVWQARKEVALTFVDDALVEADEELSVILQSSAGLTSRVALRLSDGTTSCGGGCPSTVTIVNDDGVPGLPRSLTALAGDGTVELSWEAPESDGGRMVEKYQYRVSADGGLSWSPDWTDISESGVGEAHAVGYPVPNLEHGIEYRFEVRAVNTNGAGDAAVAEATLSETVVSVVFTSAAQTYAIGDEVQATVTFSETVQVRATPSERPWLELDIGGSGRRALYSSGSGTGALVFGYTVSEGDEDTDGIALDANRLMVPSGSAIESSGVSVALEHQALEAQAGHKVDGVRPSVDVVTAVSGAVLLGFNELLDAGSVPGASAFTVTVNDSDVSLAAGDPVRVRGTEVTLTLAAAVTGADTVTVSYTAPGTGAIRDVAGNAAVSVAPDAHVVTRLTQPVVTIAPAAKAYGLSIDDVVFTLTRTEFVQTALAVEVALTQAGEYLDAEALTRTVTFEPGNSTAELRIHRYMFSASATQTGDLSAAVRPGSGYLVGSASSATVRMVVADPAVTVRLEQAEYRFVEGAGAASVAVVARTVAGIPRPSGEFDVAVSTQSIPGGAERGTDYVILSKLVNFVGEDFTADGDVWQARKEVALTFVDDVLVEADEELSVILQSSAGLTSRVALRLSDGTTSCGGSCSSTVTIADDDGVPGLPRSLTALAGDGTVELSWEAPESDGGRMVEKYQYRVSADGGLSWSPDWTDVAQGSGEVPAGGFSVPNLEDGIEYRFEVRAVNANGAGDAAAAEQVQAALPVITIAGEGDVTEGAPAEFTVSRTGDFSRELLVRVAIGSTGSVFESEITESILISIIAGTSTSRFTLPTVDDLTDEADSKVTASVVPVTGVYKPGIPASAEVTVRDDDLTQVRISSEGDVDEGEEITFTVTRSGAADEVLTVTIGISATGGDMLPPTFEASRSIAFMEGETERTVVLSTNDDDLDERDATVTASIVPGTNYTLDTPSSAVVTVYDNDLPSITITGEGDVTEGAAAEFTVSRAGDVSEELLVRVAIGSTGSVFESETTKPILISIFAGTSTSRFTLPTVDDLTDEADSKVTASLVEDSASPAAYELGTDRSAAVSVEDNDPAPVVALSLSPASIAEFGGAAAVTAGLDRPSSAVTTVTISVPAEAVEAVSLRENKVLEIPAGATASRGDVTLTAIDNDVDAPDAKVLITAEVVNAVGFTGPDPVTLTIIADAEDNAPPTDRMVTTPEDTVYVFTAADFGFADAGDALARVAIETLASAGALALGDTAVSAGDRVAASDLGTLAFTPAPNGHGSPYAIFEFTVSDGTAESVEAYIMTIDVTAANDPATGAPEIEGTVQVGETLTVSTAGIADVDGTMKAGNGDAGHAYTYRWVRVDGGIDTDLSQETGITYVPVAADVGSALKVFVRFTDDDGTVETLASAPTAAVSAGVPGVPRGLVAQPGDGQVELTWDAPASDGGAVVERYRYRVSVDSGVTWSPDWTDVPDGDGDSELADERSATIVGLDNGTEYAFQVRAVNGIGGGAPAEETATPDLVTAVAFGAASYAAAEGGAAAMVSVNLSAEAEHELVIPLTATAAGGATAQGDADADWSGVPVSVTFGPGEASTTFTVTATDDAVDDDGESVLLGFGATLPAGVALGTPSTTSVILVDDETETVVSVAFTSAAQTYAIGDEVQATVTFSETVQVRATPSERPWLELDIGGSGRRALYSSGSGTGALVFGYTVSEGDEDTDGIALDANRLMVPLGSAIESSGVSVALEHRALEAQAGHKVDGVRPSVDVVTAVSGAVLLGFNELLDAGSVPGASAFTVTVNDSDVSLAAGDPVRVGGTEVTLTLAAAVTGADTVTVSYTAPGTGAIRDVAGNAAVSVAPDAHVVTNLTQPVVTIAPAAEAYGLGIDDVVFTLTRTVPVEAALAVEVALTQAGEYLDAEELARTVTYEPGNSTAELRIRRHMFSASATQTGDLSAAVTPGSGYLVGSASSATVRMVVADPAVTVRLEQAEYRFVEGAGAPGVAVVARTVAGIPRPSGEFDVAVSTQSIPGGAEPGTDYVFLQNRT